VAALTVLALRLNRRSDLGSTKLTYCESVTLRPPSSGSETLRFRAESEWYRLRLTPGAAAAGYYTFCFS